MMNFLRNPMVIIIFTLSFAFFFFSLRKSIKKSYISVQNIDVLENKVNQLESEVNNQKIELENIEQPLTKEKIFRNELLLQKPNEYVVQLPPNSPAPAKTLEEEKQSPWEEWLKLLK